MAENRPNFDFHLHSYFSDGKLSPKELVEKCKKLGLKIIALTDHDNIKGIPKAQLTGRKLGVKVIAGIEFAADYDGQEEHFLGFNFDLQSPELGEFLKKTVGPRVEQIGGMVKNLQEIGFRIELEEVLAQARGSVNRTHLAYAVFHKPENSATLEHFEIKVAGDIFRKFLKEGTPTYVARKRPPAREVIELINRVGGIAVWAHPFWRIQDFRELAEKVSILKGFELAGIEIGYPAPFLDKEKTMALHKIAQDLSMLETAGSDFHSFQMDSFNKIADFDTFGLELNLPWRIE